MKKVFCIFILTAPCLSLKSHALDTKSCTEQLKNNDWPTDCLLALKIKHTAPKSPYYDHLNTWCHLKADELFRSPLPSIFLKLNPPSICKKLALNKKRQMHSLNVLSGKFLDSSL